MGGRGVGGENLIEDGDSSANKLENRRVPVFSRRLQKLRHQQRHAALPSAAVSMRRAGGREEGEKGREEEQ